MRILMTGGGTAGHVNPALAIAATIKEKQPDAEIAFVASAQPRDKARDLVPRAGYELHTVHIRGVAGPLWSPAAMLSNMKLPYLMARSTGEAARIIESFKPDLIVGTGGFACWPLCRAGVKMGIPTALHESNAIPGKAVLRLRGKVNLIMVNFEATISELGKVGKHTRVLRVGNPMMPGFREISREEARRALGLSSTDLFVLAFGGSLGAEYVNDAVVRLADTLTSDPRVHLLCATGKRDFERTNAAWQKTSAAACDRMELTEYIYDMPCRMAAADLVISRAGAMSLSELAILGKASVLIPSPYVANQHQLKNAMALVREGAGVCVEEHTLGEGSLTAQVQALLEDAAARETLGQRIRERFACPDANDRIYQSLMELL